MKSITTILFCFIFCIAALRTQNDYDRGLCMTAKRTHCTSVDKAVFVQTKDNLIYYCNECKAC